jgi:phytoene/squalene synthetase
MSCHLLTLFLICEAVAGLVGEGLSRLFACTGYEKQEVADVSKTLANTMGLLLQKTNIIRDYLEDYVDGRAFWPQEVRTLLVVSAPLMLLLYSILFYIVYSVLERN